MVAFFSPSLPSHLWKQARWRNFQPFYPVDPPNFFLLPAQQAEKSFQPDRRQNSARIQGTVPSGNQTEKNQKSKSKQTDISILCKDHFFVKPHSTALKEKQTLAFGSSLRVIDRRNSGLQQCSMSYLSCRRDPSLCSG